MQPIRHARGEAVAAGGAVGHVLPQRAGGLGHGQEEGPDLVHQALIFAAAVEDLQPQIIADEGVCHRHVRVFRFGVPARAEAL